jgi:hypothetical protein
MFIPLSLIICVENFKPNPYGKKSVFEMKHVFYFCKFCSFYSVVIKDSGLLGCDDVLLGK